MKKKRKICVVTGTRAEYGLLRWLMHEIRADRTLQLQVVAAAMHLEKEFGLTYREIEKDGFKIDARVKMLSRDDSQAGVARAMAVGISGFTKVFQSLRPDLIVVLGDRYEILAAAEVALILGIPIAHLHGGELTEGVLDDSIRHAITKMAHFHFTAAKAYRRRVIQLGEEPHRVFHVGALGLDNLRVLKLLSRKELERDLDYRFRSRNFLVTFHPETHRPEMTKKVLENLFCVLDKNDEVGVIFTKANADAGGRFINKEIEKYVAKSKGRMALFDSLGQRRYLSILKNVDVVIGNSSSGIIEAPFLGTATVNIGERQKSRLLASSIISCGGSANEISQAIEKAFMPSFKAKLKSVKSPYFSKDSVSKRIKERLKIISLENILAKRFYDL